MSRPCSAGLACRSKRQGGGRRHPPARSSTVAADRVAFIGYHMPFPSVGYVEKIETGYRYIPETYQLDL